MGCLFCDACGEGFGLSYEALQSHQCDRAKIARRLKEYEARANEAERKLDRVQDCVYRTLEMVGSLDGDEVTVKAEWLRKLWGAAQCRWYDATTADSFLSRWIASHFLLSAAFSLFKRRDNPQRTRLEKFKHLRERCESARRVFGYEGIAFDVTPEELAGGS